MRQNPNLPTLPMHLAMMLGYTLSWPTALQCASDGLLPLRKHLAQKLPHKKLHESLHEEAKKRNSELLQGVARYSETAYARNMPEAPCIWQHGNARLLDYGTASGGTIILFVPSLINRYYILDLAEDRSLLRFLAGQGIYPLVLDWGAPDKTEAEFGVDDYITNILLPVIDFLHKTSGETITLGGYCMGGVLALAAAQLRPKKVDKLALFATPWNFHCQKFAPFILDKEWQQCLSSLIKEHKTLPSGIIQSLFYLTDPFLFEEKFRRFLSLDETSRAAKDFIALEHWVNDGVPMTAHVAEDCLIGWAQENRLATGDWKLAHKKISPRNITQKTFLAIPKKDHVVPFDCAMPLAKSLRRPTVITPSSGHVGMIVGSRAKTECWLPLLAWLGK